MVNNVEMPPWLPDEICTISCKDENDFINITYDRLIYDFFLQGVLFRGKRVLLPNEKSNDGKLKIYWHIGGDDNSLDHHNWDRRRTQRIPWIKAVIDNAIEPEVLVWKTVKNHDKRISLWLINLDYLIILSVKRDKYFLITAYITCRSHTREKLLKEYMGCKN